MIPVSPRKLFLWVPLSRCPDGGRSGSAAPVDGAPLSGFPGAAANPRWLAGWLARPCLPLELWVSRKPPTPPSPPRPARTFTEEAVITNWQGHAAPKEPSQALEGSPLGPHSNPPALAHSEAEREMIQCDVTRRA